MKRAPEVVLAVISCGVIGLTAAILLGMPLPIGSMGLLGPGFAAFVLVMLSIIRRRQGPLSPLFPTAYHVLREVEEFTGAHVGAAGVTPRHVTAWREILARQNGDRYFKSLLVEGTPAGQLYGLAGAYFTDPAGLEVLAVPYRNHTGTVMTTFTCLVGEKPIREIAEQIVSGALPNELRGAGTRDELVGRRACP